MKLVLDFKHEVEPIARQLAQSKGFAIVAIKSPEYLYINPDADITDAVIDKLLAFQITAQANTLSNTKVEDSNEN